jgi:hypothetical protein
MLVKVYGSAVFGINATIVTAEVNVENGAFFFLVGLPDSAVKESQQRMDAALRNNGLYFPAERVSPSTSHRQTSGKREPHTTCHWQWGCSPPPNRYPPRCSNTSW